MLLTISETSPVCVVRTRFLIEFIEAKSVVKASEARVEAAEAAADAVWQEAAPQIEALQNELENARGR